MAYTCICILCIQMPRTTVPNKGLMPSYHNYETSIHKQLLLQADTIEVLCATVTTAKTGRYNQYGAISTDRGDTLDEAWVQICLSDKGYPAHPDLALGSTPQNRHLLKCPTPQSPHPPDPPDPPDPPPLPDPQCSVVLWLYGSSSVISLGADLGTLKKGGGQIFGIPLSGMCAI